MQRFPLRRVRTVYYCALERDKQETLKNDEKQTSTKPVSGIV